MKKWFVVFAVVIGFGALLMVAQPNRTIDLTSSFPDARPLTADDLQEITPASGVDPGVISGIVGYRERVMLMPGSSLHLKLLDASSADSTASTGVIAEEVMENISAPMAFKLQYDKAKLNPDVSYVLEAEIVDPKGSVVFRNMEEVAMTPAGHMQENMAITVHPVQE